MKLFKATFLILFFTSTLAFSQIDAKADVLGTVFGLPAIKAEYIINDDLGVELSFNFRYGKPILADIDNIKQHGGGFKIEPRFYVYSFEGGDGYYLSLYFRNQSHYYDIETSGYNVETDEDYEYTYTDNHKFSAVGVAMGYKIVFDSGIIMDYGVGLGRKFSNKYSSTDPKSDFTYFVTGDDEFLHNFDVIGTFGLGYRFDFGGSDDTDVEEF